MAINQQTLEGNWNEIKGLIHEKWGQLTNDDLQRARGNVDQLVGLIQRKTGEGRDTVERFLSEATSGGANAVARMAESVRDYASSAVEGVDDLTARAGDYVREGYEHTERMIQ
ncbi:MAG TPA: CsbD family protein, partial [Lacipirellulaceae bacterium]|nr:CsbD family protein [Lacipirellulaceae bacterium]